MNKTTKNKAIIDFTIDNKKGNKVIIELFDIPKTVKNFMTLAKSKKYDGCNIHRIIPGFMIQTGDFTKGDGTGGYSIYGKTFEDEEFTEHKKYYVSMANCGPNTNGSQFFITLDETDWLDGKHVVFGKVVKGFDVLKKIESYGTESGKPLKKIIIEKCYIV